MLYYASKKAHTFKTEEDRDTGTDSTSRSCEADLNAQHAVSCRCLNSPAVNWRWGNSKGASLISIIDARMLKSDSGEISILGVGIHLL